MDAVWYGIAAFFEFLFEIFEPIGMKVDIIFFILGIAGSVYWLWYTVHVKKGGHNFMSDPPEATAHPKSSLKGRT